MINMKFFVVAGVILVASGGLQFLVRPPGKGAIRATAFVAVGILAVLLGLGIVPISSFGL